MNLKSAGCLDPSKLYEIEAEKLAQLIRPAGYYNLKARRLKNFIEWLFDGYDGDLAMAGQVGTMSLREELLSIRGIGPETADSILLYAFGRPVFVVDTYTARVMIRHQLIDPEAEYMQIQELFESNLPDDAEMFNEYHALLVSVGKDYCKPKPKCEQCPLNPLGHVIDPEF